MKIAKIDVDPTLAKQAVLEGRVLTIEVKYSGVLSGIKCLVGKISKHAKS